MIFRLDEETIGFPDPRLGDPDGAFAVSTPEALTPERMRLAYHFGILPWSGFRKPYLMWFCPMHRFVIFPSEIHVSHSMRTLLNKQKYKVTFNENFEGVLQGCSQGDGIRENRKEDDGAWLGGRMLDTVRELHRTGDAVSVEVTDSDGTLAGGLYGIIGGRIFCGESMFSRKPSASKVALIALARRIDSAQPPFENISLIDCQFETPHLRSMGGRFITYEDYLGINDIVLPPLQT